MKTRAAVALEAGKPLEIMEVDLEGPKAGEVLVEIKATGICHTDEFTLSGADPEGIFPAILGHEGAGVNRVSNMKGVIKLKPIKKPPTGVPRKLLVTISIPNNLPQCLPTLCEVPPVWPLPSHLLCALHYTTFDIGVQNRVDGWHREETRVGTQRPRRT